MPGNKMQKLLLGLIVFIGTTLPMFADAITDRIVANLESQGFVVVQINRTWLGRMWILAESQDVRREVVFNPVTGEILRDYAVSIAILERRDTDDDDTVATDKMPDDVEPESISTVDQMDPVANTAVGAAPPLEIRLDPINPIAAQ